MPDTHRGLKDVCALCKPETLQRLPERLDHQRRREMRVRRRSARRVVFLRRHVLFNVAGDLLPVAARIGMEDIRERAPAAVAGEYGLLGVAALRGFRPRPAAACGSRRC
jgi:hypothetical protein